MIFLFIRFIFIRLEVARTAFEYSLEWPYTYTLGCTNFETLAMKLIFFLSVSFRFISFPYSCMTHCARTAANSWLCKRFGMLCGMWSDSNWLLLLLIYCLMRSLNKQKYSVHKHRNIRNDVYAFCPSRFDATLFFFLETFWLE